MRYRRTIVLVITMLTFATAMRSQAQVSLYPQVSAETNGMGGAGVSFISDNALATIANPAELGLFSLHGMLDLAYTPTIPGQLNAFAGGAGINLNRYQHGLPLELSLGVGYLNLNYSYPRNLIGSLKTDAANGLTFGIGIHEFVRLGLGYTLKWVNTEGGGVYSSARAYDFGGILQIPIAKIVSKLNEHPVLIVSKLRPVFNITLAYAKINSGNYTLDGSAALPQEADLACNVEVGLKTKVQHYNWKWLSLTWIRQADVQLFSIGSLYSYRSGLGSFPVYRNIIGGEPTGTTNVRKGWQIEIGQLLYLRGGSTTFADNPTYATSGWGLRFDGLLKTLMFAHWLSANATVSYLLNHLDLRFDYSRTSGGIIENNEATGVGFQRKPFETLSIIVKS